MFKSFEPRVIPVIVFDPYGHEQTYHLLLSLNSGDGALWVLRFSFVYEDEEGILQTRNEELQCYDIYFLQSIIESFTEEAAQKFVYNNLIK